MTVADDIATSTPEPASIVEPVPGGVIDELVAPWVDSSGHPVARLRRLAEIAWHVAGLSPDRQPAALAAVDLGAGLPVEERYTLLGVFARMFARASTRPRAPLRGAPPVGAVPCR